MVKKKRYLSFNNYQKQSGKTAIYKELPIDFILYLMTGLTGEVGEIAEKIKKMYRDKQGMMDEGLKELLKKEIGDVLWYLTQLGSEMGISLESAAKSNLDKILSRKKRKRIRGDGDVR